MRRENFSKQKSKDSFVVAVFQLSMIISIMIVLIISIVLISSCSGLTIIDENGATNREIESKKGTLLLSFAKEYKVNSELNNLLQDKLANANNANDVNDVNSVNSANSENNANDINSVNSANNANDINSANSANNDLIAANAFSRDMPDSNLFILSIKTVAGDVIYKDLYSQRPSDLKLTAGSYDVEVFSREFTVPEFDAPCYYDCGTVVVESGKTTKLSFLCRQSNGAIRLGFTKEFKERFKNYDAEVEDSKGKALYSYSQNRFLYLNPGDILIRLKEKGGNSFLITRKSIAAMEMVTVNLHSSVAGGGPGGENPSGDSQVFTGILIDTSSVWISENVVVGERRDGSTKELALSVDEIAGYVGAKGVWVSGFVAGYLTTASLISSGPFSTDTNIAIASIVGEQNRDLCAGVALTSGPVRITLNLKDNPGNLGRKVFIKGTITESYFGLKGVNSVTECAIE